LPSENTKDAWCDNIGISKTYPVVTIINQQGLNGSDSVLGTATDEGGPIGESRAGNVKGV
jgi:hypothetical protein